VFIEAKDDGGDDDNRSYKSCKAPAKSSPPTNQYQFIFTGRMPFLLSNYIVKVLTGKITFHGFAYPKLTWGSSNFVSDH